MARFVLRRLAVGILVALTVVVLSFMLTRLSGDLAISIAGPQATQTDIEIVRKAYGLDRPLYVQFFAWTGRAMLVRKLTVNFAVDWFDYRPIAP